MLPPVRAALSSSVDYHAPSQQPLQRQRIDVANGSPNIDPPVSAPLSGGRLDILSLSAQLQLAQGFSVFAETIGKLIKLPRREGEALLDYAQRLSEAVRAMNPAERAALERILNQLVKGVTLRLLAEILNNPAGPDAARFAMRMEAAQLLDRDLAARAVVSSYRQNAGVEQPPGLLPQQTAPAQVPAEPPASTSTAAEEPRTAQDDANGTLGAAEVAEADILQSSEADRPEGPAQIAGEPDADAAEVHDGLAALAPETEELLQLPAEGDSPAIHTETGIEQEIPLEPVEGDTPDLATPFSEEEAAVSSGSRQSESLQSEARPETLGDRRGSAPVFYDGPALARLSQRDPRQPAPADTPRSDRTSTAAVTGWLAEIFAEGNTGLLELLPLAAEPSPEQQALEELLDSEISAQSSAEADETASGFPAGRTNRTSEIREDAALAGKPAAAPSNASTQAADTAADIADQMSLPLVQPQVFRDGVPLPYVPYPPEERERDPEERKTRAVSATDEDAEQQHSPGEQAFEEDHATEDSSEDAEDSPPGDDAEDEGRANDLYWRMAGWA